MTKLHIRPAAQADAASMADLLNEIIVAGGTTAYTKPVTAEYLRDWMQSDAGRSAWHVATDADGAVVGFQWFGPHDQLPPDAASVATFVQRGQTGLGIGSALFEATAATAKSQGYVWLNATIRADNTGGLIYYQSRGFRDWHHDENVALDDGTIVDKISKRYDI